MQQSRTARILLVLFFAAQLATPFAIRRWQGEAAAREGERVDAARDAALARFGFRLEEVSKSAGINFTHTAPRSTRSSRTSCRRSPRWAQPCRSWTSTATAGKTST